MKKLLDSKLGIVLLACAGLAALVMLAPALRQLAFQPAVPFSLVFTGFGGPPALGSGQEIPAWKIALFGVLVLVILIGIFFLLTPEQRKRLLIQILRFSLVFGLAAWVLTNLYKQGFFQNFMREMPIGAGDNADAARQAAGPVFAPPPVNPWLVFGVSFGLALGIILAGWAVYTRSQRKSASESTDELGSIASEALNELASGQDWDDAIVQAYVRMNEVVMKERREGRQPGNTPREFARRMEQMGLPGEAVRTLTGLFEGVRYGGKSSSPAERELAAAALSAIAQACQRKA